MAAGGGGGPVVTEGLFRSTCELLGYRPDDVLSIRLNAREVVVVTAGDGELQVTTHPAGEGARTGTPRPLRGSRERG